MRVPRQPHDFNLPKRSEALPESHADR